MLQKSRCGGILPDMIVDGKAIAAKLNEETKKLVAELGRSPILSVFSCDPNFATNKYLTIKQRQADALGITMKMQEFDSATATDDVVTAMRSAKDRSDALLVQLPFPTHIDTALLLNQIPPSHDADALNPTEKPLVLSPVVGALEAILNFHEVRVAGKTVTVVGNGRLVGKPTAEWLKMVGGIVTVVDRDDNDLGKAVKEAEIVVLGAGEPGLITPDMITTKTILLDAGTSEAGGKLQGDADAACAEVAKLFTPVPGGIGPVTVAILFKNVLTLASQ